MMSDDLNNGPKTDLTWGEKAVQNFFTMWIEPEIKRRQENGTLSSSFRLLGAQIIFGMSSTPPVVRLNSEVRAVIKAKPPKDFVPGQPVYQHEVGDVQSIELTEADPNAAHVTLIQLVEKWVCHFDFRYNATRVADTLKVVNEFLESARSSLAKGHLHAFVESLWSASELLAKAFLLWSPDPRLLESKTHAFVHSEFNKAGHMGNVQKDWITLLNRMTKLRNPARYLEGPLALTDQTASEMLLLATRFYEFIEVNNPVRREVSS